MSTELGFLSIWVPECGWLGNWKASALRWPNTRSVSLNVTSICNRVFCSLQRRTKNNGNMGPVQMGRPSPSANYECSTLSLAVNEFAAKTSQAI